MNSFGYITTHKPSRCRQDDLAGRIKDATKIKYAWDNMTPEQRLAFEIFYATLYKDSLSKPRSIKTACLNANLLCHNRYSNGI